MRDFLLAKPYCDIILPKNEGDKPRLEFYAPRLEKWWGDERFYLVNFAKNFALYLKGMGAYYRWQDREFSGAIDSKLRLRLLLDSMDALCRSQGARFGFVSLDRAVQALKDEGYLGSRKHPELKANFPVLEAQYGRCYFDYPDLQTPHTQYDDGHPNANLHRWYSEQISAWLRNDGAWDGACWR